MNNSDIAKKYGINEDKYFSEECLKFYSKNERDIIDYEHNGFISLNKSGYKLDEKVEYYVKTNKIVSYEFEGKEYDLFEYKDCFTYSIFLCNEKLKKFRYIIPSDYKDFAGDGVYVYKGKYYCYYFDCIRAFLILNRNQVITRPGPIIMKDIKIPKPKELISKYFDIENEHLYLKLKNWEFLESDDERIREEFSLIYAKIMKEAFKIENPSFKTFIEDTENEIDKLETLGKVDKLLNKQRILYETEEFRNFCDKMCSHEIFYKELLKNGEVRKNLKNNFWIYHEFESSLRDSEDEYIQGEDYTFLILNAIKSLEYLLYRKIKDYKEFQKIDDNETEKVMLNKMINYIDNNKDMIKIPSDNVMSKNNFNAFVDSYIKLLIYVKDECRNGYFHKHRIDDYKTLNKKRKKVLEAIAKTIIILQ